MTATAAEAWKSKQKEKEGGREGENSTLVRRDKDEEVAARQAGSSWGDTTRTV